MDSKSCPLTSNYITALEEVTQRDTWLGDSHFERIQALRERAEYDGRGRVQLQLRAFLALEIMATRGLVDIPLASIVQISKLRWPRSAAGITQLLRKLRAERDELTADTAEYELTHQPSVTDAQLRNDRRVRLIMKYNRVEAAAVLLRRSLRDTDVWESLGVIGTWLADATEHLGFEVRLNITNELLNQDEEASRRAWEQT